MTDPYRDEAIQVWVSDYLESSRAREHGGLIAEYAPQVLVTFLRAACAARDVAPADIEEGDIKAGLVDGLAALDVPASVRSGIPPLCASFLEEMEAQGRLGGGRTLALYARALKPRYVERASGKGTPLRGPETKLGRNDPCPCGSGAKYKRCCMNRLGGA